jgi:hypothetical protein
MAAIMNILAAGAMLVPAQAGETCTAEVDKATAIATCVIAATLTAESTRAEQSTQVPGLYDPIKIRNMAYMCLGLENAVEYYTEHGTLPDPDVDIDFERLLEDNYDDVEEAIVIAGGLLLQLDEERTLEPGDEVIIVENIDAIDSINGPANATPEQPAYRENNGLAG